MDLTDRKPRDWEEPSLFDLQAFEGSKPERDKSCLTTNLWTHQKALLIARYLHSFLSVTKNGIYIDAFSGPQDIVTEDTSWAARQVLEQKSNFLGRACLFELDEDKIPILEQLRKKYCQGFTRLWKRQVMVVKGDCNVTIPAYLKGHRIKPKQATFALLDQRTHECTWALVKNLATHKKGGHKIEIFYFVAQHWMNRSVKSSTTAVKLAEIEAWWGGKGWKEFIELSSWDRAEKMQERFQNELGYKYTKAFPMKSNGNDGNIMFWLIHASDHPRAIPLMATAYRSIGLKISDEQWNQTKLEDLLTQFGNESPVR
ncbi:three-Cys-motif partner protein TcmP [Phragmitibacter flavus]|uniref:Three-Cys-motif partner protein TcmP n=1 Tax=Phragmitibacter flavus TaxID=2576071 RepID=A0A5R8KH77_9BACT|nr:three-Cys-motif partner protein TcmP [Phragmitibacter flavus]TLD71335.1 three-Cys-motif partner protein TcmP [Phragmitibacter flavus]